ncbi:MAG: amidohydrolase family protein, partial [Clostridia bacterium]|nr:amidohydrolase family protein [Clostridia bacterium]
MLIDFHTHCFPDHLAPRAMASLTATSAAAGFSAHTDGTAADTELHLRRVGVDRAIVCNIATNPRQQQKVNDFAIALNRQSGMLTALGSIHPDSDCIEDELNRLTAAGIRGIKIHPDYMGIHVDDERFTPILAGCAARGLFVITHAGVDPLSPDHIHATPAMLRRVIDRHPDLTLIAAHVGGMKQCREVLQYLVGTSIYFDTAMAEIMAGIPEYADDVCRILREHDPARILFGSDLPWASPADTLAFTRSLDLPERIYAENA